MTGGDGGPGSGPRLSGALRAPGHLRWGLVVIVAAVAGGGGGRPERLDGGDPHDRRRDQSRHRTAGRSGHRAGARRRRTRPRDPARHAGRAREVDAADRPAHPERGGARRGLRGAHRGARGLGGRVHHPGRPRGGHGPRHQHRRCPPGGHGRQCGQGEPAQDRQRCRRLHSHHRRRTRPQRRLGREGGARVGVDHRTGGPDAFG